MFDKVFELFLRMFTVSLFVLLNQALFYIRTKDIMFLYVCAGIVVFDIIVYASLKLHLKYRSTQFRKIKIKKIDPINHEVINPSLPLFIFSIIVTDYPGLVIFFITLTFIIVARMGQQYFNPILIFFGYNYFRAVTEDDLSIELITRHNYIETPAEMEIDVFNKFVYFGK